MEPQTTQPDMTPEEAKASLGIATYLQQQMLPQGVPIDGDKTQENASQGEQTPKDTTSAIKDLEVNMEDKFDELRAELKGNDNSAEIEAIRKELIKLQEEDGNEDE